MIVTIDGPAGSGKSTAARSLAARLGLQFLDTGAMYRVVAWRCLEQTVNLDDRQAVARVAESVDVSFLAERTFADGIDVSDAIRTPDVTEAASIVAVNPRVREAMVRLQRKAAEKSNIVTEGRDQGTVVFPQANCKFFLVAEPEERARRRTRELEKQGECVSEDDVLLKIQERDTRDATRSVAPLRQAANAIRIDTSRMSREEVLDTLEQMVRAKMSHE